MNQYNNPNKQKSRSQKSKTQKEKPHSEGQKALQTSITANPYSAPQPNEKLIIKATEALNPVVEADLGLDISSAVTGVVLLDRNGALHFMGHISLSSNKLINLFDKADAVIEWIKQNLPKNIKVNRIFVEANAKSYSKGASSANTLFTLAKINALVSYLTHKWFNVPVIDIHVTSARSKIGYKNNKGDKRRVKDKVREFVLLNNPHLPFKTRIVQVGKNKGAVVPANGIADQIDAFVVCRGGQLLNP